MLLVLALLASSPSAARAAACCGGGHGLGQRLGPMERAAASASLRMSDRVGSHDPNGRFSLVRPGVIDGDARADLAFLVAPVRRLQLGLDVPFLLNLRRTTEQSAWGGGIGDVTASARFDIVPLSSAEGFPAVALTAAASIPTGKPLGQNDDPLGARATGLGAAEIRPGIFVEKTWEGTATAIFAASVGLRTPMIDASGEEVRLGPRARFVAAAGPVFHSGLSLSFGVVSELESAPRIGSTTASDGGRRRTAALGFVGYDLGTRFTLLGSIEVDLPISLLGKNEPSAVAVTLGLRRAFSWRD